MKSSTCVICFKQEIKAQRDVQQFKEQERLYNAWHKKTRSTGDNDENSIDDGRAIILINAFALATSSSARIHPLLYLHIYIMIT